MKTVLFFFVFALSTSAKAQSYLQENFDNEIPTTWTITDAGDANGDSWFSGNKNGLALNGSNAAIVDSDANGNGPHLIETLTSPPFDSSAASFLFLDFQQYFNNFSSDFGIVEVWDGSQWIAVLTLTSDLGGLNNPDLQHIDITAYKNAAMQIRFHYNDNAVWAWYWMIDNVHVYNALCIDPSSIALSNITDISASISWVPGGTETSWEVIVQPSGSGAPTNSGIPTSSQPFIVTGLIAANSYEIYIRSDCGSDGFSIWLGPVQFITLAAPAPVTFMQQFITTSGSNRAVVDMNGDHLDDIISISANNINIQEQQAAGGFIEKNISTPTADFTPSWSLSSGDYDNNGFNDLLYAAGSGVTFMRANSDGSVFTEFSGSENIFSQRSNFVDINNDGFLDAFVCHDVAPNVYYINDGFGNLVFYQGADLDGVPSGLGVYSSGGNYGSIWVDYDNDGDQDLFIAKCGGEEARRTNQMHRNEANGDFTEVAASIGLADPMQTWSSAWGDFDNDGDLDVFVGASSGTHKLMRNDIDVTGTFMEVTVGSGVLSLSATGIENVCYDFDNDGNLDIASNGNILFGNGDLTFSLNNNIIANGGAFGDLNQDGFIDQFSNGTLYLNEANTNNWITIYTEGTTSNANGIGARIIVETASGQRIREVRSGDGFRYMNSLNTHFGIGTDSTIISIHVEWPSGTVDEILNPAINQALTIVEGTSPLSVAEFLIDHLILYPNPVRSTLHLNPSFNFRNAKFSIYDITGKRVTNAKISSQTIDVSFLSAGLYILRITKLGVHSAQKFIKK